MRPWVVLALLLWGAPLWARPLVRVTLAPCITAQADVLRLVGIELSAQLLQPGEAPPPGTTLAAAGCGAAGVWLRVDDPVTGKSLSRTVDLKASPSRARTRLLALALAELIFASWTELEISLAQSDRAKVLPPTGQPPAPKAAVQAAGEVVRSKLTANPPVLALVGPTSTAPDGPGPALTSQALVRPSPSLPTLASPAPTSPPLAKPALNSQALARPARATPARSEPEPPPLGLRVGGLAGLQTFVPVTQGALWGGPLWGGGLRIGFDHRHHLGWQVDLSVHRGQLTEQEVEISIDTFSASAALLYHRLLWRLDLRVGGGGRVGAARLASFVQPGQPLVGATLVGAFVAPTLTADLSMRLRRGLLFGLSVEAGYVVVPVTGRLPESAVSVGGPLLSANLGLALCPKHTRGAP